MQIYRIVNRYYLIINKIKSSSFPSFDDIQEHLISHDTEISLRTMQRDLQNIRNEFGIEIVYNKAQNGYFINTEHDTDYEYFMRFFEMTVMSGKLTETLKNESDISKYIAFDTAETISGLEYMQKILYAIRENFQIRLKYQRFTDSSPFDTTIAPGFLKEYQKRWYLIAWNFDLEDFRTYGLDRINELEISEVNFNKNLVKNWKDMFESVIGVSSYSSKPELIELSFDPEQGKYIKTLPLHHTQTIITDDETEFRILLKVVPNYELTQRILSQGERVEVIKPEWLREEIKEICRKILNR
jgi:predicted DNA-binding transcriptional regulator YafY